MRVSPLVPVLLAALAACDSSSVESGAAVTQPAAADTSAGEPARKARYVPIMPATDATLLAAPAQVSADPESRSQVSSVASGQIERTLVRLGQRVTAGDPIVWLRAPELLQAAAAEHSLQAQLGAHQERLAALESLTAEGLAKRESSFALRAQIADLEARAAHARATLQAAGLTNQAAERMRVRGYLSLRAPISGVVSALHAPPGGSYAPNPDQPLAEIVGSGSAWIAAELTRPPPTDMDVRFETIDGRSLLLDPEPSSRLALSGGGLRVFYRPAAGTAVPDLVDGLAGRVHFSPRNSAGPAIAPGDGTASATHQVHTAALRHDDQGDHLWVLRDGERLRVSVRVQARGQTVVLVQGPLQQGDRAIIDEDDAALRDGAGR